MRYRKMDADGDYVFGDGQADFWRDQREAVAQAVLTRLYLQTGEWYLDTADGTDWKRKVLGKYTLGSYDMIIRGRILGTQGVTGIAAYESRLEADSRSLRVIATISTAYGETTVTGTL